MSCSTQMTTWSELRELSIKNKHVDNKLCLSFKSMWESKNKNTKQKAIPGKF
jgi:hypothetical protein